MNPKMYVICSICVDCFKPKDDVVVLKACGHMFHKQCLNINCPNCPKCHINVTENDRIKVFLDFEKQHEDFHQTLVFNETNISTITSNGHEQSSNLLNETNISLITSNRQGQSSKLITQRIVGKIISKSAKVARRSDRINEENRIGVTTRAMALRARRNELNGTGLVTMRPKKTNGAVKPQNSIKSDI
ncbi:uncharacterized protein LOC116345794 [Contarinia nasturtii]|uniref:uncharacterized protein LOC116345794 n=1 Tax=Contarinia nasturtii TaxID=265458 RepID=UPI0012D470EE|nr:uncharacterized protein LOC116345794 [Contarinia nasturtii]